MALATSANAAITLIEDFETYTVDATLHDAGDIVNYDDPSWRSQRNSQAATWRPCTDSMQALIAGRRIRVDRIVC